MQRRLKFRRRRSRTFELILKPYPEYSSALSLKLMGVEGTVAC